MKPTKQILTLLSLLFFQSLFSQSFGIYVADGSIISSDGTPKGYGQDIHAFYSTVDASFDLGLSDPFAPLSGLEPLYSLEWTQLVDGTAFAGPGSWVIPQAPSQAPASVGQKVLLLFVEPVVPSSLSGNWYGGLMESSPLQSISDTPNLTFGFGSDHFSTILGVPGDDSIQMSGPLPGFEGPPPAVPEPCTYALLLGLTGLAVVFKKWRR